MLITSLGAPSETDSNSIAMPITDESWFSALAHAEYANDKAVLIELPREPPGGPAGAWGCWVLPGVRIERSRTFDVTPEEIAYANSPGVGDRLRVVLYTDAPEPVVFGFARHEIEHIRQAEWSLPALEMSDWTQHAIASTVPNLPGSASIYNLMPRESDANAAAREALRACYPEALAEIARSLQESLVAESPLPNPQTMMFRTASFAGLFSDAVEREASAHGQDLEAFLTQRDPAFVEPGRI